METFEKTPISSIDELEHKLLEGEAEKVEKTILEFFLNNQINIEDEINVNTAQYFRLLSVAYKECGKFKDAEETTLKLLNYFIHKNQKENIADCYLILAVIYRHVSKYNESLKNLAIASSMFEESGHTHKAAKCQQTLGLIYYLLEYYEEAEVRVRNAQRIYSEAQIKYQGKDLPEKYIQLGLISCKHLLGIINFDGGGKGNALEYLLEAKDESEKINRSRLRGYIYQDLGRFYLTSNRIDPAIAGEYIKESEKIRKELFDNKGIAICLLYKGILESKMVKWDNAINYYLQALEKSTIIDALNIRIECNKMLFEAYTKLNKKSEAISAINDYLELKQREYESKQTNRVQLEKLLPLDAKINELNTELKRSLEAIYLSAEVLNLLLPAKEKSLKHKRVNEKIVKSFNNNRAGLMDERFEYKTPSVIKGLLDIKEVLTENGNKIIPFWMKEKEEFIYPLYELLISHKLISDCSKTAFKNIICDGNNNPENDYINWIKNLNQFAFLIYYLEENKLLDPEYYPSKFKNIKSKFKKDGKDFTVALNKAFSDINEFLKSDMKAENIMKNNYLEIKKLAEELVKK